MVAAAPIASGVCSVRFRLWIPLDDTPTLND